MSFMKIFQTFVLMFALFVTPLLADAHGADSFSESWGPGMMMRFIEDGAVGSDAHEEMEELMERMFAGDLTEAQAQRMTELMEQYPGAYGMMMNRLGSGGTFGGMFYPAGHMGAWGWFGLLFFFAWGIWIAVGLLVLLLLWRKLAEKRS